MNTSMDVASVVLFIVLIMYAAIKLDEAARKLRSEEERILATREEHEVKLYSDRGDKYYLFGQFELYLMLIQCVIIGILVALTYVLIRLGGGV